MFKNNTLMLQHSIDRNLIFTSGWLQVLTIINIVITPLARLLPHNNRGFIIAILFMQCYTRAKIILWRLKL